jgi:hypothetical protein
MLIENKDIENYKFISNLGKQEAIKFIKKVIR